MDATCVRIILARSLRLYFFIPPREKSTCVTSPWISMNVYAYCIGAIRARIYITFLCRYVTVTSDCGTCYSTRSICVHFSRLSLSLVAYHAAWMRVFFSLAYRADTHIDVGYFVYTLFYLNCKYKKKKKFTSDNIPRKSTSKNTHHTHTLRMLLVAWQ